MGTPRALCPRHWPCPFVRRHARPSAAARTGKAATRGPHSCVPVWWATGSGSPRLEQHFLWPPTAHWLTWAMRGAALPPGGCTGAWAPASGRAPSNWAFLRLSPSALASAWSSRVPLLPQFNWASPSGSVVRILPAMQEQQETWVQFLGREDSLEVGHGNSLQYSCLENPVDRGAWWATVYGAAKSWTWLKRLSMHNLIILIIDIPCWYCHAVSASSVGPDWHRWEGELNRIRRNNTHKSLSTTALSTHHCCVIS